jgi:DNA-directed RNA polymerase specialized sigma24 family protein
MLEMLSGKLYNIEDSDVMVDLQRYVGKMAMMNQVGPLTQEDVESELWIEIVKGLKHYADLADKEHKKAVLYRMVKNRLGELKYRYYITHRSAENVTEDLDAIGESVMDDASNPETIYSSMERVEAVKAKLSPSALSVLEAILYDRSENLAQVLIMAMTRASAIYAQPSVNLKPRHVADALRISEKEVQKAFAEIKKAYREVCNG